MAYEKRPLSSDLGGGIQLQLCPANEIHGTRGSLASLTATPRRRTCGECAFHISSAETYWRCRYDRKHRLLQGSLTWLPLLWLTTAAACFVCVDSAANSGSKTKTNRQIMLTLIICLSLHFAVITVVLRGWRSTNTRSILAADWVRRTKELAPIGTFGFKDKTFNEGKKNAKWTKKNKKNKTLISSRINCYYFLLFKMWRQSEWC